MAATLLIVSHRPTDGGSPLEPAVALAEAARSAGVRPVLAAHATCPPDAVPGWLEFWPVCRTGRGPEVAARVGFAGVRCDPVGVARANIDAVLDGRAGMADYIATRFEPWAVPAFPVPAAPPAPPTRTRVKHTTRDLVPPFLWKPLQFVRRKRVVQRLVRGSLPPVLHRALKPQVKAGLRKVRGGEPVPAPEPVAAPPLDPLDARLHELGLGNECEPRRACRDDLELLLGLSGVGAADHVFVPCAHGRDLLAALELADRMGRLAPTFHLRFRDESGEDRVLEAFFDLARRRPPTPRVRAYADCRERSEAHRRRSGFAFHTLPTPPRAGHAAAAVLRALCGVPAPAATLAPKAA